MESMIVMTAATNFHLFATIAPDLAFPCAETVAGVSKSRTCVISMSNVMTAPMSLTLGQIARIVEIRVVCPAQVFPSTVQNFATDVQHVQMLGTNYYLPANPKFLLEKELIVLNQDRTKLLSVARRPASIGAKTAPGVFVGGSCVIV